MTSYIASLLTTTTSRVATLRQNLLPNENDGDSLEETHICRVLRAYYTEKGRNFPAWLPPDPKAPQLPPQQVVLTNNVGQNYGGGIKQTSAGKEMSSLWGSQERRQQQQAPASKNPWGQQREPKVVQPAPQQPKVKVRQLPSKRKDSYQVANPMSAKDKFKMSHGGGRAPSPMVPVQTQASYAPSNNYEDQFMPRDTGYGGNHRGESSEEPFVAATAPWANSATEFNGAGYNPGYGDVGRPQGGRRGGVPAEGLPPNPRKQKFR